jgi:hypothetical protein
LKWLIQVVLTGWHKTKCIVMTTYVWGPFAKFMDSPYYSKSELCGGVVVVSFSKYLPWQVMHFLQYSTHFLKMCCRPLITSKFLASELPFHGWESPEITWGEIWIEFCFWLGKSGSVEPPLEHVPYSPDLAPCDFWAFPIMKRDLQGKKFKSDQQSAASLAKGSTLKNRLSPHLHEVPTQSRNGSCM